MTRAGFRQGCDVDPDVAALPAGAVVDADNSDRLLRHADALCGLDGHVRVPCERDAGQLPRELQPVPGELYVYH